MKKGNLKALKKVKKATSKALIKFTYYFFYGFFNYPQGSRRADPNLMKQIGIIEIYKTECHKKIFFVSTYLRLDNKHKARIINNLNRLKWIDIRILGKVSKNNNLQILN